MLTENTIPNEEPVLAVGIILPEDEKREIILTIPGDGSYALQCDGADPIALLPGASIRVHLDENGRLRVHTPAAGKEIRTIDSVVIAADEQTDIGPRSGLVAHDIIAGREFHWKKFIDVPLPGTVEIRAVDSTLVMINHVRFEHYLMCVATSEMGAECPQALIEAQTIAARSWMLANVEKKHRSLGMDVCNDDCCQRYQGTLYMTEQSRAGAEATWGQTLLYDGSVCDARYSKSCGGVMEAYETIWGGEKVPYLIVKRDAPDDDKASLPQLQNDVVFHEWVSSVPHAFCSPHVIAESELKRYLGGVDEEGEYYRWHVTMTQREMTEQLNRSLKLNAAVILEIQPLVRGGSGRVSRLAIHFRRKDGVLSEHIVEGDVAIRRALHPDFLFSAAFEVQTLAGERDDSPSTFSISGCGWGHGVGLCQIGALGMALEGYDSHAIVAHYYPGSSLKKLY